ncbi:cysteine hydrolase [Exiguobacterium sp. SH1S21]|uniref:cysteine hydrolase family protein n=1 Tax=Exiguobacterium sp. SH1S21 TaxID=2510953 RepID=UPI00103E3D11|nr:cysteine hydrolase family protein [Exiguobacterium sp. SH1S21]TCI51943.1 cysteine hydrolase [Exiguobacterium sp. SH1S21]
MKQNTVVPLLIIDVQRAFRDPSWGNRNNPMCEDNIARLITTWEETDQPIIYIQHVSQVPESLFYFQKDGHLFQDFIRPRAQDTILTKQVNSAFIGTNLEELLEAYQAKSIIVTGLITNHCVETTARMAGNLGFGPIVVSDATATFDRRSISGSLIRADVIHDVSLANLNEEFATIQTTDEVIAMIQTKAVQAL